MLLIRFLQMLCDKHAGRAIAMPDVTTRMD